MLSQNFMKYNPSPKYLIKQRKCYSARGGFRVQKKVVTNFCKIDTIYVKVTALIFVVIVVVIIIIADVAILFCFESLVATA